MLALRFLLSASCFFFFLGERRPSTQHYANHAPPLVLYVSTVRGAQDLDFDCSAANNLERACDSRSAQVGSGGDPVTLSGPPGLCNVSLPTVSKTIL